MNVNSFGKIFNAIYVVNSKMIVSSTFSSLSLSFFQSLRLFCNHCVNDNAGAYEYVFVHFVFSFIRLSCFTWLLVILCSPRKFQQSMQIVTCCVSLSSLCAYKFWVEGSSMLLLLIIIESHYSDSPFRSSSSSFTTFEYLIDFLLFVMFDLFCVATFHF